MNKKSVLETGFACILISGCSVYDNPGQHQWYGTYNPSLSNGYTGLIAYEPGADITSFMQNKCALYGGLDLSSVRDGTAPKIIGNNFGFVKQYRCYGPPKVNQSPVTTPSVIYSQPGLSIDEAKKKCADLGLKSGTEVFGKCVLQLHR